MTIRERMALDLAGRHYRYGGVLEADVREQLGMSLAQHAQMVRVLLDRADVEAEAPQLVHRLRRLREQRAAVRAA